MNSFILPKICGGDLELGNFIAGATSAGGTGYEASRLLLREIDGVPGFAPDDTDLGASLQWSDSGLGSSVTAPERRPGFSSQDSGRKFLRNGGCAYIDLNHLEVCLPEVRSARDHVRHTHALYRLAQRAADAANRRLREGYHIVVLANNTDGHGARAHSFGSHLNLLVQRDAWEKVCHRRLLHQGFLAAFQVSSIVLTGLGKVGAENDTPPARFQISQRADFIETLCSWQTTERRPVINTRDEALCGRPRVRYTDAGDATAQLARMHVITYDHNLCHVAGFLKVGMLQLVLAMLEAGCVHADLLLEDPVLAMVQWSHDPLLRARARLWSGAQTTAVELQWRFLAEAQRFVASGACAHAVPEAEEILHLWHDTLQKLQARDFDALRRRLDWVLKLALCSQALRQRPALTWEAPELKHLDQLYSHLDPAQGLYWSYEKRGLVDRLASDEAINTAMLEPPVDTRAWTRGQLLQRAAPAEVDQVDWDFVRFKLRDSAHGAPHYFTVDLPDPRGATAAEAGPRLDDADDLPAALTALAAIETPAASWNGTYTTSILLNQHSHGNGNSHEHS